MLSAIQRYPAKVRAGSKHSRAILIRFSPRLVARLECWPIAPENLDRVAPRFVDHHQASRMEPVIGRTSAVGQNLICRFHQPSTLKRELVGRARAHQRERE